jgi:hypothetical protein
MNAVKSISILRILMSMLCERKFTTTMFKNVKLTSFDLKSMLG